MIPRPSYRPAPSTPAPPGPAVRLITVSAAYGAGGSVVAPALADRFGLPFLQRVTTSEGRVAEPGPCDEQLSEEEVQATPVHRLLAHFTQAMPAGPTQSPPSTHHQDEHLRDRGEAGIDRLLAGGGGVILGRAGAVVLGKDHGFHVRLDGPADRRARQGAAIEGISEEQARERLYAADKARTAYVRRLYRTDPADRRARQGAAIEGISEEQARERLGAADKARTAYVRRLYRTDPADPSLYHLVVDSTAMPLDTVVELIVTAARAHEASVPERGETP